MKRQDGDAGGQLLKGQQGIPLEFLGYGRGGELGPLRSDQISGRSSTRQSSQQQRAGTNAGTTDESIELQQDAAGVKNAKP